MTRVAKTLQSAKVQRTLIAGYLLKVKSVEFDKTVIKYNTKNHSNIIPINKILGFVTTTAGFLGGTLLVSVGKSQVRTGFLKEKQLKPFADVVNSTITCQIASEVERTFEALVRATQDEYLRDSSIAKLDELTKGLTEQYQISKPLWKKYLPPKTLQMLKQICACVPLTDHAQRIRMDFETQTRREKKDFFNSVEKNPLTTQQQLAVIRNNDRNLVLAAAGTGKTSVIAAKTLHLINNMSVSSTDILVLAYNNAAAAELRERIEARAAALKIGIKEFPKIKTFHALGREMLRANKQSTHISIFEEDRKKLKIWVTDWLSNRLQSSEGALYDLLKTLHEPHDPFKFETAAGYEAYIRDNELRTLQGDLVKGYQELLISNWLFSNSIEYEYEPKYMPKRRIDIGYDYKPDFYIVDADAYLEHFGIDRDGQTRPGIDAKNYNQKIVSKRELHEEQETKLLQTFHYDWLEGNLEARLEQQIRECGLKPIPYEGIFNKLNEIGAISDRANLLLDCLKAIRVEGLSDIETWQRLNKGKVFYPKIWAEILCELHEDYRSELENQNAIDFDDMIIRATDSLVSGGYRPEWSHVLVDEFQDISSARMNFIERILASPKHPTFTAVGDDWQAIYRFSGGKLQLITQFDKLIGSNTTTKLDKSYRYNDSISHIAGTFVMENPEQYKKEIETHQSASEPQVYLLDEINEDEPSLPDKVEQIIQTIRENDMNGSIAVLARYRWVLDKCRRHNHNNGVSKIHYWTFHGSKGLEADYCILTGLFQGKSGFPNYKRDAAVKEALLPQGDDYPHSEERRLLYVALTRARNRSYLVADALAPSEFIVELLSPKYELNIVSQSFGENFRRIFKCPKCQHGYLKLRKGTFGEFYSCTTGHTCKIRPRKCDKCGAPAIDGRARSQCSNSDCGHSIKICTQCGRPMHIRNGQFGKFWGCSGYGLKEDRCKNKERFYE